MRWPTNPIRRLFSLLIDTGPAGDPSWRFSTVTLLAFIGPGSVPLAYLLFMTQWEVLSTEYDQSTISLLTALVTAAAVVVVRFNPVVGWMLWLVSTGWIAVTAVSKVGVPWPVTAPGILVLLVVQFAVARDRRPLVSFGLWLTTIILNFAVGFGIPQTTDAELNLTLIGFLGLGATIVGWSVRAVRNAQERVASEERLTAEERGRRQILEERTRIARELHDVVAHHMSVITVQASTAPYRLPGLPEEARAEFTSIGDQARESLSELRRLLTVLRDENAIGIREPQPGLERLEGLLDSVRRSGTPVDLDMTVLPNLSEALSLTGYRIIQEALSNVVRHAPGAATRVTVSTKDEALFITVVNGPPESSTDSGIVGAGLGLAGMRERVKLLDGRLDTAPTDDGGFAVHAVLPLKEPT